MTTKVTLETHDWPARVVTSDNHSHSSPERASRGWTHTEEFVPANTKREFHVTNTRSIQFYEMDKDAVGLPESNMLAQSID